MFYSINYDNGYIVTCSGHWADGNFKSDLPLRKFKNEGDAKIFKEHDCPQLTDSQLKALVKHYNPNVKFIRLGENKYRKC